MQRKKEGLSSLEDCRLKFFKIVIGFCLIMGHGVEYGRPIEINYHSNLTLDELRPGFTEKKGSPDGHLLKVSSNKKDRTINWSTYRIQSCHDKLKLCLFRSGSGIHVR